MLSASAPTITPCGSRPPLAPRRGRDVAGYVPATTRGAADPRVRPRILVAAPCESPATRRPQDALLFLGFLLTLFGWIRAACGNRADAFARDRLHLLSDVKYFLRSCQAPSSRLSQHLRREGLMQEGHPPGPLPPARSFVDRNTRCPQSAARSGSQDLASLHPATSLSRCVETTIAKPPVSSATRACLDGTTLRHCVTDPPQVQLISLISGLFSVVDYLIRPQCWLGRNSTALASIYVYSTWRQDYPRQDRSHCSD